MIPKNKKQYKNYLYHYVKKSGTLVINPKCVLDVVMKQNRTVHECVLRIYFFPIESISSGTQIIEKYQGIRIGLGVRC